MSEAVVELFGGPKDGEVVALPDGRNDLVIAGRAPSSGIASIAPQKITTGVDMFEGRYTYDHETTRRFGRRSFTWRGWGS